MNHPVILGVDFLEANKAWIRFDTHCLALLDGKIEIPLGSHDNDISCAVRTIGSVTIPATSQVVLPVVCKMSSTQSKFGLIEPVQSLLTNSNLLGARCIVQIRNGRSVFRLLNPSNSKVELKPNQVIGKCHVLDSNYTVTDFDLGHSKVAPDVNTYDVNKLNENVLQDLGINLADSDLSPDDKVQMGNFISSRRKTFAKDMTELETANVPYHSVDTQNSPQSHNGSIEPHQL